MNDNNKLSRKMGILQSNIYELNALQSELEYLHERKVEVIEKLFKLTQTVEIRKQILLDDDFDFNDGDDFDPFAPRNETNNDEGIMTC